MNKLNESIISDTSNMDEEEVIGVATPTYADAIKTHKRTKDEIKKRFKDRDKETSKFVTNNHNVNTGTKVIKEVKKLKLSESLFEDYIPSTRTEDSELSNNDDNMYYKNKREPLAYVIMDELTWGETVFKPGKNGKFNPTYGPSLNLDESNIGANSDENGEYIIAWVKDEQTANKVREIADKHHRESVLGHSKFASGENKYFVKIYLNDGDWDKPYFSDEVKVRPDGRKRKVG